ncbi:MAG: prepilin-type N-terminal cleavage/methylation domain-containing protein [Candidatus Saganbacteria bacterium]|nr:prepilin-type N-terminal cleavage/methylation domain-containing protein [Candidatus Saganbacteria bacterium]
MKRGFSLIELMVSLLVIAIIIYASLSIFVGAGTKGINLEVYTTAQSLAEGMLEEEMTRPFADISSEAATGFSGELNAYTYQLQVDYVSAEAFDQPVGSTTDYKKIAVSIMHPKLNNPITLEAVKANY